MAARPPREIKLTMNDKLAPARKMLAFPGTPASGPRDRRPAVWPWLVMPLIVLLVYYALFRVHQQPAAPHPQPAASQISAEQTSPPPAPH
jgi:hypothetical protein